MATILVVDDAEFLRLRVSKLLTSHGHTVVQAGDGFEAIGVYKTSRPDLVLLDITMPEMDGLAALKEIKAFDPRARVVILSALGHESVAFEAVQAGADDFVIKPFEADRVLTVIRRVLSRDL